MSESEESVDQTNQGIRESANQSICQVQVFSGSKSGRILDQGGEDGRADVGLGRE